VTQQQQNQGQPPQMFPGQGPPQGAFGPRF
jgi:hypothetical protein